MIDKTKAVAWLIAFAGCIAFWIALIFTLVWGV